MIITAGEYKGRKVCVPDENITRPTLSKVRMGVFNTLYSIMGDFSGKRFLDTFGGSGIMGLEALSRGFDSVLVFEKNKKAAEIIKKNYSMLGIKPNLYLGDSLKILAKNNNDFFDVVYIDPPYKSGIYQEVLDIINCNIAAVEHSENLEFEGYKILKQKNYGGKFVSFLKKNCG